MTARATVCKVCGGPRRGDSPLCDFHYAEYQNECNRKAYRKRTGAEPKPYAGNSEFRRRKFVEVYKRHGLTWKDPS